MKRLCAVYAMFTCGAGAAIGLHEASLWAVLWKSLLWPGIAGYEVRCVFSIIQSEEPKP